MSFFAVFALVFWLNGSVNCSRSSIGAPEWSNVSRARELSQFLFVETVCRVGQLTPVLLQWKSQQRRTKKAKSISKPKASKCRYLVLSLGSLNVTLIKCSARCLDFMLGSGLDLLVSLRAFIQCISLSVLKALEILLIRAGIEPNPGPVSSILSPEFRVVSQNCRGLTDCRKACRLVKKLASFKT